MHGIPPKSDEWRGDWKKNKTIVKYSFAGISQEQVKSQLGLLIIAYIVHIDLINTQSET